MHSSWYSRRRTEAFWKETGSGAVGGAKVASRRTVVETHIGRSLRQVVKLRNIRCMPHVA